MKIAFEFIENIFLKTVSRQYSKLSGYIRGGSLLDSPTNENLNGHRNVVGHCVFNLPSSYKCLLVASLFSYFLLFVFHSPPPPIFWLAPLPRRASAADPPK